MEKELNALQRELVAKGIAKEPKGRKRKERQFTCNKCGEPMYKPEGTNVMACTKCGNYFIFESHK